MWSMRRQGMYSTYMSTESNLHDVRGRPSTMVQEFRSDLEAEGFKFNPYSPCVANHKGKGSQYTVLFHVDNLKSSHKDSRVNDEFGTWLQKDCGQHGGVVQHHGKKLMQKCLCFRRHVK